MASVNKVILVGNVGADPDTRYMPNGDAVCNLRLATSESWKDRNTGEKREVTEWHRVVCYRKLAEIVTQYVRKGSALYLEGRIKTRKWQDRDGQDRYATEIEVTEMQMLGNRRAEEFGTDTREPSMGPRAGAGGGNGGQRSPERNPVSTDDSMDDDIPFITASSEAEAAWTRAMCSTRRRV